MNIQEVHNRLKEHGIRPLPHKVAIMKYLLENYNHPTIENIYHELLPTMPTLSKTTVYNTLKSFCDNKAVTALLIDERNLRYEAHLHLHAHFKCKQCGAIFDVPLKETDVPRFRGSPTLAPDETHVYYMGKCDKCNATPNDANIS